MDMTGEYRIPAPRQRVWEALNDPEVLRQSIPGCQSLEKTSDTEFTAKVRAKVGPVNATFNGKVNLTDLDPPSGYKIQGEGTGGVAGFAKGGADVRLREDGPEATVLQYEAKAEVGGKLAQIGSRLVQGTAKKMADDFFGKFTQVVGGAPAVPAAAEMPPKPTPAPEPAPAPTPIAAAGPAAMPKPTGVEEERPAAPPETVAPQPAVGEGRRAEREAAAASVGEAAKPSEGAREATDRAPTAATPERRPSPEAHGGLASNPFVWVAVIVVLVLLLFWILA